jgi:hypothetical protein
MQLFSLSPLTTVTLSSYTNAPILRPFKFLILWQLFTLSPRSLLPSFDGGTSFSLRLMPPLSLHLVVWRRLPFFHILLLRVFLGVMTPPPLRLHYGHLLPLSPVILLFLPPLVALILTGSPALLLSPGEWGVWRVPALSVALPPPMGFSPQDLHSTRASLLPPLLSIIASSISWVPFPRWFLRLSLVAIVISQLLWGLVMLLHLLCTIVMRLHLWRLHLLPLLRRWVLCLTRISLLLWRWTSPCPTLLWRFHHPLLHLLMASLLLPRLLLLLSWSSLPLRFLFGLRSLSSSLSSRTPTRIWMCTSLSSLNFVNPSTPPNVWMMLWLLLLLMSRLVSSGRGKFEMLFATAPFVFFLTIRGLFTTARALRCWPC